MHGDRRRGDCGARVTLGPADLQPQSDENERSAGSLAFSSFASQPGCAAAVRMWVRRPLCGGASARVAALLPSEAVRAEAGRTPGTLHQRRTCQQQRAALSPTTTPPQAPCFSACAARTALAARPPSALLAAFSHRRLLYSSHANDKEHRSCPGCGVRLQTTKAEALGYLPREKLEASADAVCMRCWHLRHHNKLTKPQLHDVAAIEEAVRGQKCTLVALVDLSDLAGTVIPGFSRLAAGRQVLLVANKLDLLPAGAREDRVRLWLRREAERLGLGALPATDVFLLSAKTGEGFTAFASRLRALADSEAGRRVFVVGATNVGKSSFLCRLLDRVGRQRTDVTVSPFPGTTLDVIALPLRPPPGHTGPPQTLFDTPGVANTHHFSHLLSAHDLQLTMPSARIRPITYRVVPGKSLFVGGLARIDVLSTAPAAFVYLTLFLSSPLVQALHATRTDRADALYRAHLGGLLAPPTLAHQQQQQPQQRLDFPPLEAHAVEVAGTSWTAAQADISLAGAGWVAVTLAGQARLAVHLPYPLRPAVGAPLMPFELEGRAEQRVRKHGKVLVSRAPEPADLQEAAEAAEAAAAASSSSSSSSAPVSLRRWQPADRNPQRGGRGGQERGKGTKREAKEKSQDEQAAQGQGNRTARNARKADAR